MRIRKLRNHLYGNSNKSKILLGNLKLNNSISGKDIKSSRKVPYIKMGKSRAMSSKLIEIDNKN